MARKVMVLLNDDLDGQSPADETVRFAFDGAAYEIDLTNEHADELRRTMSRYTTVARTTTKARLTGAKRSSTAKARKSKTADIRVWAREHGKEIGDRGRIPNSIVQEYEAAQ